MTNSIYEVRPVRKPHDICTSVPGSKSITNRALLIAALAQGRSVLHGVLFSDDSRYFMKALQDLGFPVEIDEAAATVTIEGYGGEIPCSKSVTHKVADNIKGNMTEVDASIYVGSAGTAARFLTAFLGLSKGMYRMTSSEQMKKRPMKELLVALESIGTKVIYEEEPYHFPFIIGGFEWNGNSVSVDVEKSSQFLSAFLISSVLLPEGFTIDVIGSHGMAYVNMTLKMMEQFGVSVSNQKGCYVILEHKDYMAMDYAIEPDLSAACYFYALSPLLKVSAQVKGVHFDSLQGDIQFLNVLDEMGCELLEEEAGVKVLPPKEEFLGGSFDLSSFSDQTLTLAAIAPFTNSKVCIMNVGHIRYQECDRIEAILHNLSEMGIMATCEDGNLFILPGTPHGCEIETYEDHRVAMAFSLPGVLTDGIKVLNPSCTRKTFENYFEVLEASVY